MGIGTEYLHELLSESYGNYQAKRFLLAVSGGVDSMVLLSLMRDLRDMNPSAPFRIAVAHINYHLRGEDSCLDEQLVYDFCVENKIDIHIYNVSEKDNCPDNASIQLWARELRYRFFNEIMDKEGLDILLTAHHLEDQWETFLINLSRGTGIRGLCGINSDEHYILRPLLNFTKEEIYAFAKANGVPYREDKSNQKDDYQRNKIRNHITPILKEMNIHFLRNFQKSINYLTKTKNWLEDSVEEILSKISEIKGEDILLNKLQLAEQEEIIKFEIFRKFGFKNTNEISKILTSQLGSVFHSDEYELWVDRVFLILKDRKSQVENNTNFTEIVINTTDCISEGENIFTLKLPISPLGAVFDFDYTKLCFPLKIRKRKEIDVFYPIGMQGRKKLSKFFKDEKYSILQKEETLLLVDNNEQILLILPHRQDRRAMATIKTQKVLKVMV